MIADPATSLVVWHPVADDLPPGLTAVLAATNVGFVHSAYLAAGVWYHLSTRVRISKPVTHWAHFPAPPTP